MKNENLHNKFVLIIPIKFSYVVNDSSKGGQKRDESSSSSSSSSSRSSRSSSRSNRRRRNRSRSRSGSRSATSSSAKNKVLFITSFGQEATSTSTANREEDDEAKQNEFLSCLGRGKVTIDNSYQNLKRLKQNVARSSSSRSRSNSPSPNANTSSIDIKFNSSQRNEFVFFLLHILINYLLRV